MNENEITQNEEEISLLDLFAVLIKHRLLIILGTMITTVIAGLFLFIVPKIIPSLNKTTVDVSYNVKVQPVPTVIMQKLPSTTNTPNTLAIYNMSRIQFLVEEFKNYPVYFEEDNNMSAYQFNGAVQKILTEKKYKVEASKLGGNFDIKLQIPLTKIDEATKLVKDIVSKTNEDLVENYIPLINELSKITDASIEKAMEYASSATDMSTLQALQNLAVEIDNFDAENANYLTLNETPFVIPQARGRMKKLVIACFAAFFIFVFIAFLLNAIENIKADPEASKVISDAWTAGKKCKK